MHNRPRGVSHEEANLISGEKTTPLTIEAPEGIRRERRAANMKLTSNKRSLIEELVKAVNNDLVEAILHFEVSCCGPAAVARFNAAKAPGGLNVITFALPLVAATALCRIWDTRKDTTKITGVAHRLRDEGRTDKAVEEWRKRVMEIAESADVEALRRWRHERLAHSSQAGDARGGDDDILDRILPSLLNETIVVVETLNRLLGLNYRWTLSETQQNWRGEAADFWRVAVGSQPM
jgi:hypothetical protein